MARCSQLLICDHWKANSHEEKTKYNNTHYNFCCVDPDNKIRSTQQKYRLLFTSVPLPLTLSHTHAYNAQHAECAVGFIRKMVLILLSALLVTNRQQAPWNIWLQAAMSFSHIGRMKLEIMWDLWLFSKQRIRRTFQSVHLYCLLRVIYCICLYPMQVINWKNWCDTRWHICASCAWTIKLPPFRCSIYVFVCVCFLHVGLGQWFSLFFWHAPSEGKQFLKWTEFSKSKLNFSKINVSTIAPANSFCFFPT